MRRTAGRWLIGASLAVSALAVDTSVDASTLHRVWDHDGGGVYGANSRRIDLYPRFDGTRIVAQIFGRFRHRRLNGVEVWLDTNFGDAGPEYRVAWLLGGDGDGANDLALIRVGSFTDIGRRVRCHRLYGAKHLDRRYVEVSVPHACIGSPASFHISTTTWDFTNYDSAGNPVAGHPDGVPRLLHFTRRSFG